MDEAFDLEEFLPISFKTPSEREYISFLWGSFEENYHYGRFQFAFLAYHMLTMSFVYFKVWQIRQTWPDDFEKGLIGFARDGDRNSLRDTSPFTFSNVNERTILRLLRLIGCDESQIGNYRKLVDDRNNTAHANGNIYFKSQPEIDAKIHQALQAVQEIQSQSQPVINRCYKEFLLQSRGADVREYSDTEDQIREVLIHDNYLSHKDIEICVNSDISALEDADENAVADLHNFLCQVFSSE